LENENGGEKMFKKTIRGLDYTFLSTFNYWKNNNNSSIFLNFFKFFYVSFFSDYIKKINIQPFLKFIFGKKKQIIKTDKGLFEIDCVGDLLILHKYYEYSIKKIIDNNLKKFETEKKNYFINIGAYIGKYIIKLNKKNYKSLGFEPVKNTNIYFIKEKK
jgi:hypothetical protein